MPVWQTILIVLLAAALVAVVTAVRTRRKDIRKVAYMMDALEDGELNFRFKDTNRFNRTLNRIRTIFEKQRQAHEQDSWTKLIRVLTHEIMNSLTPIISISETLAESLPQGGGQEGASVINRRCHSLLDFVESYRQLTRIKAPERTTFPVSDLFEHIKVLFPQVNIKEQVPSRGDIEGAALSADRSQLEQVLINLVKNAYESGATEVRLTAQPLPSPMGGGGSAICVEDNGRGMAPDVLANAFIPFYTTKPSGTGIGLALCRQIILKHGGRISVESQAGRGTTFTIELPQA